MTTREHILHAADAATSRRLGSDGPIDSTPACIGQAFGMVYDRLIVDFIDSHPCPREGRRTLDSAWAPLVAGRDFGDE